MIDIQQALYNILHSRYGRDVRESLRDAVYQINENANEALQNAKTMGVGTLVSSPTSSSAGYVAGNLYLNSQTWDLWQCAGTNSWVNKGNIKGAQGDKGIDGTNEYIHIRYSQYYDGTDFTVSPTASSAYMGIYYGTTTTAPVNKNDYKWVSFVGASGVSSYVYIMYSENPDGENFISTPTANTKYIGFYSGALSSPPANKAYYTWSEYVGKSGSGTGDMLKSEYAGKNIAGTVDRAAQLYDEVNQKNADTEVLAKLSEVGGKLNYNGKAIDVDIDNDTIVKNDSDQLQVAEKITKKLPTTTPTASDAGKVATVQSDGSVDFEEPQGTDVDLTDVYGTSEEWSSKASWNIGEVCIDGNKLWEKIANGTTRPTEDDGTIWKQISLKELNEKIKASGKGIYFGKVTSTSWATATNNDFNISDYNFVIVYLMNGEQILASQMIPTSIFKNIKSTAYSVINYFDGSTVFLGLYYYENDNNIKAIATTSGFGVAFYLV